LHNTAATYIERFNLQPHPEGGYYKRNYQSKIVIGKEALPNRFEGDRFLSTAIYYLLEQGDFSAFHRLKSDECWHFYAGGCLNLFVITDDGNLQKILLGNNALNNETPQHTVHAGLWFAAAPCISVDFSFAGCTVAPGFDFDDLEFASRNELIKTYPSHKEIIERFTR